MEGRFGWTGYGADIALGDSANIVGSNGMNGLTDYRPTVNGGIY
jgi:hypothetical protein